MSSAAKLPERPCSGNMAHESHVYWLGGNVEEAGRSYHCPGVRDSGVAGTTVASGRSHGEAEAGVAPGDRQDASLAAAPQVGDARTAASYRWEDLMSALGPRARLRCWVEQRHSTLCALNASGHRGPCTCEPKLIPHFPRIDRVVGA